MENSKQEALDFLESLNLGEVQVEQKQPPPKQQFKPMGRPGVSSVGIPVTATSSGVTAASVSSNSSAFKPRPLQFTPGIPPSGIKPPPITNNLQSKTKPSRVYQSFNRPGDTTATTNPPESVNLQSNHNVQQQYNQPHQQYNQSQQKQELVQEPVQKKQEAVQNESWGSLLTSLAHSSLTTAQKGLETARVIAKDTARVVQESQTVKDFGKEFGGEYKATVISRIVQGDSNPKDYRRPRFIPNFKL
jgi:hypothetical protein